MSVRFTEFYGILPFIATIINRHVNTHVMEKVMVIGESPPINIIDNSIATISRR